MQEGIHVLSKDLWVYHCIIAVIPFIAMNLVNRCNKSFLFFFKKSLIL